MAHPICPRCGRRRCYARHPYCGDCRAKVQRQADYDSYTSFAPQASRSAHDVEIRAARVIIYAERVARGEPIFEGE